MRKCKFRWMLNASPAEKNYEVLKLKTDWVINSSWRSPPSPWRRRRSTRTNGHERDQPFKRQIFNSIKVFRLVGGSKSNQYFYFPRQSCFQGNAPIRRYWVYLIHWCAVKIASRVFLFGLIDQSHSSKKDFQRNFISQSKWKRVVKKLLLALPYFLLGGSLICLKLHGSAYFYRKISGVAPPWGTWIKDTLLMG